jgi:glycosyltransferase involved in cell wall biosynthesis
VALTERPLPAGVIALLHGAPALEPWSEEPLAVIATSARTADAVRRAARTVTIVRPGLDACFAPPARRERSTALRIACVGTVRPEKGQLLLVETLAALPVRSACEVVLLGDERSFPDHAARVRAAARGVPLRMLGCVPPATVAREMQRADLLVSASRDESFGMAVAEAAACGTPVLAFDTGEIGSFVRDGRNGWLVDARAGAAVFAAALARLLADPVTLATAALAAERPPLGDWPTAAQQFLRACRR